jgi:hypothetical protein
MIVGCRVAVMAVPIVLQGWWSLSRSQWNGSYGANSGLSRGDLCRRAVRPIQAFKAKVAFVRFTSTPAVRFAQIAVMIAGLANAELRPFAAVPDWFPERKECAMERSRIRAVVTIAVTKASPLTSPAYDEGKTEAELRRAWTTRFRMLQPFEQFEE